MKNEAKVRTYMIEEHADHIDECGELNLTGLAEDAANAFDLYGADDEIPEQVFELAFEVEQVLFDDGVLNY